MLKIKNGKTKMRGYVVELLAEYSLLTHKMAGMLEEQVGREEAVKILDYAYKSCKMTDEEIVANIMETIANRMKEKKENE